jgi:hypothetical protein
MANTWTLWVQARSWAAGACMAGIMNGGTRVLKIRRVGFINNQTVAVTGVITAGELRYYTSATWTPTSVTPIAHDSTNGALSSVSAGYAGTPGGTGPTVLRRYTWSSDEPKLTTAQNNEWETLIPLNIIWDAGYGDSNVQPLTLRQNESFIIWNVTGAAGLVDIWIEFTDEA